MDIEAAMQCALIEADRAAQCGEVPVGAVLLFENNIIARGHNRPITNHDPSAHAEIIVLREAAQLLQNYRLLNTTLVVTLEPCAMCAAAMVHARIDKLVFGAYDPKAGVIESTMSLLDAPHFNHSVKYQGGVLAEQCGVRLREFFKARR